MDNSYTIIGRFTPPTCTLEIWRKNLPRWRWTKKAVVQDVQFKLSFDDPQILEAEPITLSGDRHKLEQLYNIVLSYTESFLAESFTTKSPAIALTNQNSAVSSTQPYLTSQGLVNHQLNLGSFATVENPQTILLSATQLFDLVAALEEYQTEMAILTEQEAKQRQKSRKFIPIGISVAGILLAVGLTTTGIKIANQSKTKEPIASQQEPPATTKTFEEVIPPEVPIAEKPPVKIEEQPLYSTETLPPPPAVDTLKPPPNIPDPAKYPLPPSGNLTIPPLASLPKPENIPETAQPTATKPQADSQVESTITVPQQTAKPTPQPEAAKPATPEKTKLEIATETNQRVVKLPVTDQKQKLLDTTEEAEISLSEENAAIKTEINRVEGIPTFSEGNLADNSNIAKESVTPKPTAIENDPESKISQALQLQEIKSYFQQKWRSPSELKQTLEYRLILNQNGSIKRLIPIGKASEIYLDRTNIPLMGEPFVSRLQDSDSVTVRLLLSPDGEVQTFLE